MKRTEGRTGMKLKTNHLNYKNKAFTLTEVMVVLVISLMLLFALYNIFNSSYRGVLAGKNKLGNLQDAAITLEYIKHDIKGAYFKKTNIKGAYFKKTNIKGAEIDGESLFKGGDGFMEFSSLCYDQNGEEKLVKISYKHNPGNESLTRSEEGEPDKIFAPGRIKNFSANLVKIDKISYIDVVIKAETEKKQKVELRNAVFPKDVQAVNKNWIPNPY
jgi:prepilin-type N-terminal cleavage/methylation domain-containing protein